MPGSASIRAWLLTALGVCIALYVCTSFAGRLRPAYPDLPAETQGDFPLDGFFRGDPFRGATGLRQWGSWAGGDEKTGTLRIGPFAGTRTIRVGVTGYPSLEGEHLELERMDTHERLPVRCPLVGERWQLLRIDLPSEWSGRPVVIVARDESRKPNGWFGVSEPICVGISAPFLQALSSFAVVGTALAVLWLCALKRLARWASLPSAWLGLIAFGLVAMAGYAAFWAFFLGPMVGRVFVIALLTLAVADVAVARKDDWRLGADALSTAQAAVAIGVFILSLLYLFATSRDLYDLAATRWLELPGDNTLPHNVAATLYGGGSLRWPGAEWQSSDRPPLQSGWMLLTWPLTAAVGLDTRVTGAAAALWFQLAWVFAVSGLLRSVGTSRRQTAAWTALLALAGFFILNTAYTWPKLAGGAFVCGSFGLWVLTPASARTWRDYAAGALLAALAWLSHGGTAFSVLALGPWVLATLIPRRREWVFAALVFALTVAPWLLYQRFYDPPGNRLLKWHLGGQIEKDPRGTWQTIREGYGGKPIGELVAARVSNLRLQLSGGWTWWRDISPARSGDRRGDEFFIPLRALTWWVLGFAALPYALVRATAGHRRALTALAAWTALSFMVWIGLLFLPNGALLHQGSYAFMIALFVLLSAALSAVSRAAIVCVGALQSITFATTWALPSASAEGPLVPLATTTAVAGLALLWWSVAKDPQTGDNIDPTSPDELAGAPANRVPEHRSAHR